MNPELLRPIPRPKIDGPPRVGDLVKLNQKIVDAKGYSDAAVGQVGLIVHSFGIRCRVQWCHGPHTLPERGVLEVISESR